MSCKVNESGFMEFDTRSAHGNKLSNNVVCKFFFPAQWPYYVSSCTHLIQQFSFISSIKSNINFLYNRRNE